jgi:S1-C subfamily serine protease
MRRSIFAAAPGRFTIALCSRRVVELSADPLESATDVSCIAFSRGSPAPRVESRCQVEYIFVMDRAARISSIFTLSITLASGVSAVAPGYRPPTIETAARATVAVTAVPNAEVGPSTAPIWSGFFVNPDGVILTDATSITPCRDTGGGPQLSVILGDEPGEREIRPASVIVCNRKRSLALLRTDHQSTAWLAVGRPHDVRPNDMVWLVGARPAADLVDGQVDSAIQSGAITELSSDEQRKVISFVTDIAPLAGLVGGPVIDLNGDVVGVVTRSESGGDRWATAVSPDLLSEFVRAMAVRIRFEPAPFVSASRPTEITAEPVIARLGNVTGRVAISGSDIDDLEIGLAPASGGWRGTIPPLTKVPGRPMAEEYVVAVSFVDAAGTTVYGRRLRLESDVKPPPVDPVRERALRGEMTLSDLARIRSVAVQQKYVIDNDALSWYSSDLVRIFPPQRYDGLTTFEDEELATLYDLSRYAVDLARRNLPRLQSFLDQNLRDLEIYTEQLRERDIVFCEDDEKWTYRKEAKCTEIVVPWEDDAAPTHESRSY